ncbi:hypothetical protein [Sphingopyxis sp. GW247-27LB]|uniref:hypothetical protein n=1 Tax=Sphingopyxis sp. GW247-27LB TaxID=2012632 RepID=UPI0011410877|nr:hypothetical protein [Sphingopyxis sp. GW247-27LB]
MKTDIVMLERQLANSERRITPELIERSAQLMREKLRSNKPALRRYYVKAIVGRVEVGDHQIRIFGSTKALEHAVGRTSDHTATPVPNIEREWRAQDAEDETWVIVV